MKNKIKSIFILSLLILSSTAYGATILFPPQGGTGKGSAGPSDVGKYLRVADDSPFSYEYATVTSPSIGGTLTSGTEGSVLFVGSGSTFQQDNTNLFWDDTNNFLGIGTATPGYILDIKSTNRKIRLANFYDGGGLLFQNTSGSQIGGIGRRDGSFGAATNIFSANVLTFKTNFSTDGPATTWDMVLDNSGNLGLGSSLVPVSKLHIGVAPTGSANYGLVSLGSGAFDGSTSGFFTGAAAGTGLAMNLASGSTSDLLNLQIAGVSRFKQSSTGTLTTYDHNAYTSSTNSFVINQPNSFVTFTGGDILKIRSDGTIKISDRYDDGVLSPTAGLHINYFNPGVAMFLGRNYSGLSSAGGQYPTLVVSDNSTGTIDFTGTVYSPIVTGTANNNNNVRAGVSAIATYGTNNYTAAPDAATYGAHFTSNTSGVSTNGNTHKYYGGYFAATPSFASSATNSYAYGIWTKATGAEFNYAAIFESGNVGVGKTTPTYKLDVYGTGTTGGINTNIGLNLKRVTEASNTAIYTVASGGSVNTGSHYYNIVYYTAIGSTAVSNRIEAITTAGNNTVNITNIPISSDPSVIGRKIYRSRLGEGSSYGSLVTTIADNTTTSFSDTLADASLTDVYGGNWDKPNTTNNFITVDGNKAIVFGSNSIFGLQAGASLTTGGQNLLFGAGAGSSITTGGANVVMGSMGLTATANQNVVIGYVPLQGASNYNTGIGNFIFQGAGNKEHNVAIGYGVATQHTAVSHNIAIGSYNLSSTTTGGANVSIGGYAMNGKASTSNANVGIGYMSLYSGGVAVGNSAVGMYSGYGNTTGSSNAYFGYAAGQANTTGSGNTFIGYASGYTNTTTDGNVFLGYAAGYYETGASKFFIDNQTRTNEATSRTSSLMYGVFNATVASQTLDINAKLTVNNNIVSSNYFIASVGDGLTAVGTDRATALQLSKQVNNVTTAAAGTGVILPVGVVGMRVTVFNNGANLVQVYASASETIDTVAGSTGVPLTNGKRCEFFYTAANTWISMQGGPISS